jgi:hypothetical protein
MKAAPVTPALGQLWSKLGIEIHGKTIAFDQTAPWASVRCAIAADTNTQRSDAEFDAVPRGSRI